MQPKNMIHVLKLPSNIMASKPLEKHNRNLMTWPKWNGVFEKQENDTAIESNRDCDKCRERIDLAEMKCSAADYAIDRKSWRQTSAQEEKRIMMKWTSWTEFLWRAELAKEDTFHPTGQLFSLLSLFWVIKLSRFSWR